MSEPFDFEAFIAGTQLARRTVHVYQVDHRDEIARLQAEHDAAPDQSGDQREGSKTSPRKQLAEKIATLRAQMDASRAEFVLRTLTPDEFKAQSNDDTADVYDQIALQSVEPKLDRHQWKRIADAVGTAQWGQLVKDANDLVLSKVAVPDFSQSVSATLNPPASSQS